MDDDEYRFEATLSTGSGKEADAFLLIAKRALANKLRAKFQQFPKDMVAHHGKDLLADAAASEASSAAGSGASTPSAPTTTSTSSAAPSVSSAKPTKPASLNTAIVRATGEFQCDAATLFDFLTNAEKVPAWSRNPATISPTVGSDVVLFGGNIKGKMTKVEAPKSFAMSWRAPTWPEEHYGVLETSLDQGSNSTTLNLKLSGVPIGKEDEAESNVRFSLSFARYRMLTSPFKHSSTPSTSEAFKRSG
jgi:activator of HSP90 ATPase